MTGVKAVVFDLDDTLYPQAAFKRSGFRAVARCLAARDLAGEEASFAALEKAMAERGPSHPFLFDEALKSLGLDAALVPEMVRVFREHAPEIAPHPGVVGMLRALRGRRKLGLLTDGLALVQRNKVAGLGIGGLFDALLFSGDLGLVKPDPRLFAWFEDRFGLSGRELAHVADNPAKDFTAPLARGWRTVRFRMGEHRDAPMLPGERADASPETVEELSALLLSETEG